MGPFKQLLLGLLKFSHAAAGLFQFFNQLNFGFTLIIHRKETLYQLILNMLRNTEINAIKHY